MSNIMVIMAAAPPIPFFIVFIAIAAASPIRIPDFSRCSLTADTSPEPTAAGSPPPFTLIFNCCMPSPPPPSAILDLSPLDAGGGGGGKPRVRRPAHKLSPAESRNYARAYELMKALPDDDPRSFSAQSRHHCAFCGGAYDQFPGGPPLEIHYSWLFLPWHRLFLYFHERILASLLDDPTFALPFWNWDDQKYGGNHVPEVFLPRGSSLYDAARRNSAEEVVKLYALSETTEAAELAAENLAVMSRAMVKGATTAELFEGGAARLGTDVSNSTVLDAPLGGSLENGPHNAVHFWAGSPSRPLAQDMGSFPTGARDPIFYAHHSNVDRLWEIWRCRHADHGDADFLDAEFLFFDEWARPVKVRARDALDLRRLGIAYESVEAADRLWVEYAAPPLQPPPTAAGAGSTMNYTDLTSGRWAEPLVLRDKLTLRLRLPEETAGGGGMVLVLEGVRLERDRFVQVVAFVNYPWADERTTTAAAECVGIYGAMPAAGRRKGVVTTSVKFRVPASLLPTENRAAAAMLVTLVLRKPQYNNVKELHPYNVTFRSAKLTPFVGH